MSYQNEKFVIKVNNDYDISNKLLFISFIFQKKKTHSLDASEGHWRRKCKVDSSLNWQLEKGFRDSWKYEFKMVQLT